MLIATAADGCSIGQIRLDLQPPSLESDTNDAMVGLSLDRCARGHGLAAELVRLGLQEMGQRWGSAVEAVAEVLPSNTASNACFARAGFIAESEFVLASPLSSRVVNRWRWRPTTTF